MPEANDSPSSSRALVRLVVDNTDAASRHHVQTPTPSAFVAQLIASARRLPQVREKRRADPAEAIAAYQATIQRIRNLNQV
jgi:hypothetical protein